MNNNFDHIFGIVNFKTNYKYRLSNHCFINELILVTYALISNAVEKNILSGMILWTFTKFVQITPLWAKNGTAADVTCFTCFVNITHADLSKFKAGLWVEMCFPIPFLNSHSQVSDPGPYEPLVLYNLIVFDSFIHVERSCHTDTDADYHEYKHYKYRSTQLIFRPLWDPTCTTLVVVIISAINNLFWGLSRRRSWKRRCLI